jgi:hypothetical protein
MSQNEALMEQRSHFFTQNQRVEFYTNFVRGKMKRGLIHD